MSRRTFETCFKMTPQSRCGGGVPWETVLLDTNPPPDTIDIFASEKKTLRPARKTLTRTLWIRLSWRRLHVPAFRGQEEEEEEEAQVTSGHIARKPSGWLGLNCMGI